MLSRDNGAAFFVFIIISLRRNEGGGMERVSGAYTCEPRTCRIAALLPVSVQFLPVVLRSHPLMYDVMAEA